MIAAHRGPGTFAKGCKTHREVIVRSGDKHSNIARVRMDSMLNVVVMFDQMLFSGASGKKENGQ